MGSFDKVGIRDGRGEYWELGRLGIGGVGAFMFVIFLYLRSIGWIPMGLDGGFYKGVEGVF